MQITHLTNVPIRVEKLNTELELVPDLNAASVRILQTLGQGLGQREIARKLISLGRFINDFQIVLLIQLMLISSNRPRVLVGIAERLGIIGIQGQIMALDELRNDLPNSETFEERDQSKVDLDVGAEDDGFGGCIDRVFNLVRPYIFHRLRN